MKDADAIVATLRPYIVSAKSGYAMAMIGQYGVQPTPAQRATGKLRSMFTGQPFVTWWRLRAIDNAAPRKQEITETLMNLADSHKDHPQFATIKANVETLLFQSLAEAEQRFLQD